MENNPQAGLVMPKVFGCEGQLQMFCKLLPTPFDLAARRFFPFKGWFKNQNEKYEMKASGYRRVMNVPFLSGCFMFLRNESLKKAGLFDERFFLYAEDTDLSRRIHQQFETLFYPGNGNQSRPCTRLLQGFKADLSQHQKCNSIFQQVGLVF